MAETRVLQAAKADVPAGLDAAMSTYAIAALTRKEGKILFDMVQSSREILFEYAPTILSPKKFFF